MLARFICSKMWGTLRLQKLENNWHVYSVLLTLGCVYTMKIMCIRNELIRIACIHTECALTTTYFECAFSQSPFIGGLKPVWRWIASWCKIMQVLYLCAWSVAWRNEWSGKHYIFTLLWYTVLTVMACVTRLFMCCDLVVLSVLLSPWF